MATIVAAAGGGNWTTGATWVGGVAPTAADDAQLTAASGNVTIDNTACVCRSLDCTGYTNQLTMAASRTLTIGDATAGAGNIALKLVAGMTFAPAASTSLIVFASTSGTQQTVATGGKTLQAVTFSGAASSYQLTSSITLASTLALIAGMLDTNGQTVSIATLVITGATTKTLTLGASSLSCAVFSAASTTNLTFNCNTSTVTCTGDTFSPPTSAINTNATVFNNVILSGGNPFLSPACVFANLTRTGPASKTSTLALGGNQVVTGVFTCNGNSDVNRMHIYSSTGTARTITAGTVTVTRTDFQDITGAGAGSWNLSAITGGSGDCGGNSGITFTTGITCYAVGITGTAGLWSTHGWMTTSGGATPARVPLPQDDAVLDANSGSGTKFTLDMPRRGRNLTWNRSAMEMALSVNQTTFGSLTIIAALSVTGGFSTTLGGRGAHTLNYGGLSPASAHTVDCPGGTYTLDTNGLTLPTSPSTGNFTISRGGFDTNNLPLTVFGFFAQNSNTKSITFGTSTITITGAPNVINITANGTTFSGASSTIVLTDQASAKTFHGNGLTYGVLTYTRDGSTGSLTITSSNSFSTINFSDVTNSRTLNFGSGTTTTIRTAFNVNGTAGKLMTIAGVSGGSVETLTYSGSGDISSNYLSISNLTATPSDTWYAGTTSTDGGGNSGWTFTDAPVTVTGAGASSVEVAANATASVVIIGNGAAEIALVGTATGVREVVGSGAADIAITADALAGVYVLGGAASTIMVEGTATGEQLATGAGSADIAVTSDATASVDRFGAGSSVIDVTADSTGMVIIYGSGASAIEVGATGSGNVNVPGAGASALELPATASGQVESLGVAESSVQVAADATGGVFVFGAGSSSIEMVGTASGNVVENVSGFGAADIAATANATGVREVVGNGASDVSVIGTSSANVTRFGSGQSDISVASNALANVNVTGSAESDVAVSATSTGAVFIYGSGSSVIDVSAVATANVNVVGMAASTLAVDGTASGIRSVFGFGTAEISVTGDWFIPSITTGFGASDLAVNATAIGARNPNHVSASIPSRVSTHTGPESSRVASAVGADRVSTSPVISRRTVNVNPSTSDRTK